MGLWAVLGHLFFFLGWHGTAQILHWVGTARHIGMHSLPKNVLCWPDTAHWTPLPVGTVNNKLRKLIFIFKFRNKIYYRIIKTLFLNSTLNNILYFCHLANLRNDTLEPHKFSKQSNKKERYTNLMSWRSPHKFSKQSNKKERYTNLICHGDRHTSFLSNQTKRKDTQISYVMEIHIPRLKWIYSLLFIWEF